MAKWYEKISKNELSSFLEKNGKLISSQVAEEKPSFPKNLETKKISKFYFEGEIFEVVCQYVWEFRPGNGWTCPGGHTGKDGEVISITTL